MKYGKLKLQRGITLLVRYDYNMRKTKIIASICFLSITFGLLILSRSSSKGYEQSIYSSTPLLFWISIFFTFIGALYIILYNAYYAGDNNNFWLYGFVILLLINFIILSLSSLRGYYQYSGSDNLNHLKFIQNTIENGTVGMQNIYPSIHIFISAISIISSISPISLIKFFPAYFSVLFLNLFMYPLANSLLIKGPQRMLVCTSSFVFLFNNLQVQLYPHLCSVFLFVPIMYILIKKIEKKSVELSFLFIIFSILVTFTHPSSSLVLIFTLFFLMFANFIFSVACKKNGRIPPVLGTSTYSLLIPTITLFMWISSFTLFDKKIINIYSSIFSTSSHQFVDNTAQIINRLNIGEIIQYNLKMYSDSIIYIIFMLVIGFFVTRNTMYQTGLKKCLNKNDRNCLSNTDNTIHLFIIIIYCIISIPIAGALFLFIGSETVGRLLNLLYMGPFLPIFVGLFMSQQVETKGRKKVIPLLIGFYIIIFATSTLSVYHSPWIYSPNWQVTNMDSFGVEWYLNHHNETIIYDSMGISDGLLIGKSDLILSYIKGQENNFPFKAYAIINERCKQANLNIMLKKAKMNMRSGWDFNMEDFQTLYMDQDIKKLYSNGELDILLIDKNVETKN